MPLGVIFWILMILWFVFGLWGNWPVPADPSGRVRFGGSLLLFVLLFIIGWKLFGFVVQG
jgi:hypothetical protein